MRAWLLDDFAGLKALRLSQWADPAPGPDEVVLGLEYAALNPADRYLAERQYPARPKLPHILGRDGFGTVLQAPTTSHLHAGDRRAVLRGEVGGDKPGTFAERVAVPADGLVAVPPSWSPMEGAGATLTYLTAYQALTMWGALGPCGPGDPASPADSQLAAIRQEGRDRNPPAVVLVTGASGGVGVAVIQLATAMGHIVVGLSRSEEKARRLEQLGARQVFNPQNANWPSDLKAALAPARVDLAIDNVGGRILPQVLGTLGDQGKVSLVGRLAGPVPEFNTATLFFRRLRLGGVAVGAYTPGEAQAAWGEVLALLARTGARPLVDSVFPFEKLPQAFARLAEGPLGKVVLEIKSRS